MYGEIFDKEGKRKKKLPFPTNFTTGKNTWRQPRLRTKLPDYVEGSNSDLQWWRCSPLSKLVPTVTPISIFTRKNFSPQERKQVQTQTAASEGGRPFKSTRLKRIFFSAKSLKTHSNKPSGVYATPRTKRGYKTSLSLTKLK